MKKIAPKAPDRHLESPPGGSEKRRRRSSPDNDKLLEKAFDIFVELGFDGASIDAISASVGVAKRTLYLRHGDKEGLFRAAFAHAIEKWLLPVDRLREAETEDLAETLLTIGRLLLYNILSPGGQSLLQLTNAVAGRMPELGAHNVEKGVNPWLTYLTELVSRRAGRRLQPFLTPEDAAMAFMNLVVTGPAIFVSQGVPLDQKAVDHYVEASVSLFLHGFLRSDGDPRNLSGEGQDVLFDENQRLKELLAEALVQLEPARQLEEENSRLKRLVADLSLEKALLQDGIRKRNEKG